MTLVNLELLKRWASSSAADVNGIYTAIKNSLNGMLDSDNVTDLSLDGDLFSTPVIRTKNYTLAAKTELFQTSPAQINQWVQTPIKVAGIAFTGAPTDKWFVHYFVSLDPWFTPSAAGLDPDGMVTGLQPQYDNSAAPYTGAIRQKGDLGGTPGPVTAPDKVAFGISLNGGAPIVETVRILQSNNWLHQLYRYDELGMNYGITASPKLETFHKYRPFTLAGILTSDELGVVLPPDDLTLMICAYDDATYPTLGASAARTFETENNIMQTLSSRYDP